VLLVVTACFVFTGRIRFFFTGRIRNLDAASSKKKKKQAVGAKKKHDFVHTEVLVAGNLMRQVAGDTNKTEFTTKKDRQ
jgi:hypothetical protein